MPAAWPVLQGANALRRRAVARARSVDMIQWENVTYGADVSQRMHIWELNDLAPRDGWGAVILLHGGGWREGSWEDFLSLGPALARRGLYVAALDYRLAPAHRWPAQIDDVLAALEFLEGQWVDPNRIALWGHSAGGHLAMMAGLRRPERVRCVVAMGAPSDLQDVEDRGESLEEVFDRDQLRSASPIHQDCEQPPPTLLVHGTLDRVVHIEQSRRHQALRPDTVELIEIRDGDHGLRWPPMAAWRARRQAIDWMVDHLDLASRGSKWKRRKKGKR